MNPGRELDALVAEKVMGYEVSWHDGECYMTTIRFYGTSDENECCEPCLNYSTDIATAWEVVEKISETMWIQIYNCLRDPKSLHFQWCCEIEPDKYREAIEILADTAPHAICLAALKAVGVKI